MSDYLAHHGVLGQKWGVRRYQNHDGTRTAEGKKREMYRRRTVSAGKTKQSVDEIISTMNSRDRYMLLDGDDDYLTYEMGSSVAKRILVSDAANTPIAFMDLIENGKVVDVAIGTRSGDAYRGKGYATQAARKGLEWYEKNKDRYGYRELRWTAFKGNKASRNLAKKLGLQEQHTDVSDIMVDYTKEG